MSGRHEVWGDEDIDKVLPNHEKRTESETSGGSSTANALLPALWEEEVRKAEKVEGKQEDSLWDRHLLLGWRLGVWPESRPRTHI